MSRGYFAGVDLHKSVIQVCALNGRGVVILEQRFAGATRAVADEILTALKRYRRITGAVNTAAKCASAARLGCSVCGAWDLRGTARGIKTSATLWTSDAELVCQATKAWAYRDACWWSIDGCK